METPALQPLGQICIPIHHKIREINDIYSLSFEDFREHFKFRNYYQFRNQLDRIDNIKSNRRTVPIDKPSRNQLANLFQCGIGFKVKH